MEQKQENIALTEAVYYILLTLQEPLHGYGIMQETKRMSGGRLLLSPGTLYGAISSMLDKGWIEASDLEKEEGESRKKEYVITYTGIQILKREYSRLKELVENGKLILEK